MVTRFKKKIKNWSHIFYTFSHMTLCSLTFPADVEGVGSSSWADVFSTSCSNFG
jgi:hypothetical protein